MRKKEKTMCQYEGCLREAKYALYRFYPNFTKKWINVCDRHDKDIAQEAQGLRFASKPDAVWKEVKI